MIILKKNQPCLLNNKFFLIKNGKVEIKNILESGRVIPTEYYFSNGDIIGNFFKLLENGNLIIPEIELEVESLTEKAILEEVKISDLNIEKDTLTRIILSIVKILLLDFYFQAYDLKEYLLTIFKLYSNDKSKILKKDIRHKKFNISKSYFYSILSKLKEEEFIDDEGKYILLNIEKIDKYLNNKVNDK